MKGFVFTKADIRVLRLIINWVITLAILAVACLICSAIKHINSSDFYVPMVFVLAVLIISLLTEGYFYGLLAALLSVLGAIFTACFPPL